MVKVEARNLALNASSHDCPAHVHRNLVTKPPVPRQPKQTPSSSSISAGKYRAHAASTHLKYRKLVQFLVASVGLSNPRVHSTTPANPVYSDTYPQNYKLARRQHSRTQAHRSENNVAWVRADVGVALFSASGMWRLLLAKCIQPQAGSQPGDSERTSTCYYT